MTNIDLFTHVPFQVDGIINGSIRYQTDKVYGQWTVQRPDRKIVKYRELRTINEIRNLNTECGQRAVHDIRIDQADTNISLLHAHERCRIGNRCGKIIVGTWRAPGCK